MSTDGEFYPLLFEHHLNVRRTAVLSSWMTSTKEHYRGGRSHIVPSVGALHQVRSGMHRDSCPQHPIALSGQMGRRQGKYLAGNKRGKTPPRILMLGVGNQLQPINPRCRRAVSSSSTSSDTGLPALSRWISGCSGAS